MQVIYQGKKYVKGRDGGDYYSDEYVYWLETQFEKSRQEVHMMAAKRNKWKGLAQALFEELEGDL